MQHIINRLLIAGDDDSFRDKYYWDAARNRLYLVDSTPACLCISRGPVRLKVLQEKPRLYHCRTSRQRQNLPGTCLSISMARNGRSVKEFVRTCDTCQRHKSARTRVGLLQPLPAPERPWETIQHGLYHGPVKNSTTPCAVFTFVDKMTKYVHVIPTTSTIDAEGAARLYINNVFTLHGLSKSIVSDRDPRFTSAFF